MNPRLYRLLLDPTADTGGAAPSPEPSVSEPDSFRPEPEPAPVASPAPATSTSTDPNPAPAAPVIPSNVREAARQFGVDLSQFPDDTAAFAHLLQQQQIARQQDYYSRVGQALLPHASKIQTLLQQPPQAATQERPAYEPPPFDERWMAGVQYDDASRMYIPRPGFPAELATHVNNYAEWRQKFLANPSEFLNPMVENRAKTLAEQIVNERLTQRDTQAAVAEVIRSNADWLYAPNPDPFGNRQLSPAGQRYGRYIQELQQAGVTDVRAQDRLAKQMLRADLAAASGAQPSPTQQAVSPGNPAPVGQVNPLQALATSLGQPVQGGGLPSSEGLTLHETLRRNMGGAGVSDADIRFDPREG